MSKKTIVVFNPVRFAGEAWLPMFWAQAKTYYERHGENVEKWNWAPCYADTIGNNAELIKQLLQGHKPDVFAISLYVWNYTIAFEIASWVKETWPTCVVITGGPHQHFKHHDTWFKDHPYIDASLPGENYGELCIKEVLDELVDTDSVDWDSVTDVCYPKGKSRFPTYSKKQSKHTNKKNFDYSWSAASSQRDHLLDFINYAKNHYTGCKVLTIFETTRGCPYGCTYCDWGGGINSIVVHKPLEYVKADIDAFCTMDLSYVYYADANFGIFGDRDVEISQYLADQRKQHAQTFTVGYGGFAKTENKLPYIRDILKIDVKHGLSILGEIKVSVQSLDDDVLNRIDRKNVSLDKQLEVFKEVTKFKKVPIYVELINGLPGMTLEKFYHELDVLGDRNLSIQWYPWILLPEAPAYSNSYREVQKLQSVVKNTGWWTHEDDNSQNEIVVGTSTYTTEEYLEMMLSSSLYRMFVQGGIYRKSIKWIKDRDVSMGGIVRSIYTEFLSDSKFISDASHVWNTRILKDPYYGCFIDVDDTLTVYLGLYFVAIALVKYQEFTEPLGFWLHEKYGVPIKTIQKDQSLIITKDNLGSKKYRGMFELDYNKKLYNLKDNVTKILLCFIQFKHTGSAMVASKKFLGII